MALFRLLEQTDYLAYHSYWYGVAPETRSEQECRILSGNWDSQLAPFMWAKTRAAEWIGCINEGRRMAACNHLDTIFAPVFAALHTESVFVYLHRDPVKIFESFFSKNQWSKRQLCPVHYAFEPFRWRHTGYDVPVSIAWYLRLTEVFCRAFGELMGEKFIEVSADKLFTKDKEEISDLLAFCDIDMPLEHALAHYTIPYNHKAHKIVYDDTQVAHARESFLQAYRSFGGEYEV